MALNDGQPPVLLENVKRLINQKVKNDQAELVADFSSELFSNISREDLTNRTDSDLYGAVLSLWNTLYGCGDTDAKIRVFNPELSKHGWESSHTIVEIVVKDMPFLVDSVRMALNRVGIASHLLLHTPLKLLRDKSNKVKEILSPSSRKKDAVSQTVFLIEIDRQTEQTALDALTEELHSVMKDIVLSVDDWPLMQQKLEEIISGLPKRTPSTSKEEVKESVDFLKWIADHNFTLMGYRQYEIDAVKGDYQLKAVEGTSLGLLKNIPSKAKFLSKLTESARHEALSSSVLVLTKTNTKSRVHRPAHIDYVGIKRFDDKGNVIGEDRFIGLYSASFYNNSAGNIPLLKNKLERIMKASAFANGTHSYKALLNILENYPRDELIQASEKELLGVALGVLQMQERDMTRVFIRKDVFGRFYSCMVFVPRERYNTALRKETQRILQREFNSDSDVEFTTFFSESVLARTHYIVRTKDSNQTINVKDIERNLIEAARTWEDKLGDALLGSFGEAKGKALTRKYALGFPRAYKEAVLPSSAVVDIEKLERLCDEKNLEMLFYRPQEEQDEKHVHFNLFHKDEPLHLSDVLPMLENFGLRVIGETPYAVKVGENRVDWLLGFSMIFKGSKPLKLEECQQRFQEAFADVWFNHLEDDGFNRLVLGAGLSGREASILRSYAKYARQLGSTFSQSYIEDTFDKYPHIAELLVKLFNKKFSPKGKYSEKAVEKIIAQVTEELEHVANLDDDRIIRMYLDMMNATLRTNYFQVDADGHLKDYISFKVQPEMIPDAPLPLPKYEIFVYSPKVEGVHLRGGKVARGGLRWSDRREDFRTEVLGLVKAQQVKNTVIVPVGSKGGFVGKQLPTSGDRDAFFEAGKECYRTFIRGLLDITDNIVHGEVVYPELVVRHDDDDPYLVVAADKGTATFSDIANEIAGEYNFWLGDAFASGGSIGYDHKKMGITARGAWESVKRHFREIGIDCQNVDFTAVAVGDMAGDVFGNGMLLSKHTRLVAAFNHMHIFFDPEPDAKTSYAERDRLFKLPRSSWEDYNSKLISEGGGIFSRSLKSIKLTPQMKRALGTQKSSMTPNELIKSILKMPVDLLWNGGIGTYIKAANESHADAGDRANDPVRIDGHELNAKIFGEGGNLGATQLGRIEYAANGGRANTDFIDNVGGVDCSDNEVNIKILLNSLVAEGDITVKQRNALLYDMTDDVSKIVLEDCYRQTHTISITALRGPQQLKEQIRFIHALEKAGKLDRELEFLPSDEELSDRLADGKGLTRPELSVLVAYAKMVLKEELVSPEITELPYFKRLLIGAFPPLLQDKFSDAMEAHPLRAEIIATQLANDIVNDMGLNFVERMREETGAPMSEVVVCYAMAREIFELHQVWNEIAELDNKIPSIVQTEMLFQLRRTVRRATRWFLRHRNKSLGIEETVNSFKAAFADLSNNVLKYLDPEEKDQLESVSQELVRESVPKPIATRIALLSTLFSVMDIAQVADAENEKIQLVAETYFKLGAKLGLHWFLDQINHQPVSNHWQALARASYREELDWQQRALTSVLLRQKIESKTATDMIDAWVADNLEVLERWHHMLAEFKTTQTHEFAKFSVALRELMLLSHHCDNAM